ncbi:5-hydroxytryptamine receptor 1D-like [Paramacrobiotus metropolitanus]|uniref:5-hydroxytryptamine receptor 1D-like n=1 Tax=Paramacrobiotus metropolitanus TaxID=2943436 RepID=UPI002445EF6C|nr:5-hydroxytryptamine receptor 1D-like [Paramacrobiotus metropolitanus]
MNFTMDSWMNYTNITSNSTSLATTQWAPNKTGAAISAVADHKYILAVLKIAVTPAGMILNGILLLILIANKTLHTSFAVYVFVILLSSFLYASLEFLLVILENYGDFTIALCYLQQCSQWLISAQWVNAQLQICLNRIWALTFPISYKERHTKRVAVMITAANWAMLYMLGIPTIVLNTRYFPANPSKPFVSCITDMIARGRYTLGNMIMDLTVPTIIIILSYPYLLYRQLKRSKKRKAMSAENPGIRMLIKEDLHAFLVLTSITVSVALFWAPISISFILLITGKLRLAPDTMQLISYGFALCDLVMNPCLICLSAKDLRMATLRVFRCRVKKGRSNVVHPRTAAVNTTAARVTTAAPRTTNAQ